MNADYRLFEVVQVFGFLVLVEHFWAWGVLVELSTKLEPVVFSNTENFAILTEVQAVLKPQTDLCYLVLSQTFHKTWFFPMNIIFRAQLATIVVTPSPNFIRLIYDIDESCTHADNVNIWVESFFHTGVY